LDKKAYTFEVLPFVQSLVLEKVVIELFLLFP
jgi:hypothetical protein